MDPSSYARDLSLARKILAGSESDWHDFVGQYTPLIRAVLRSYVHDDEVVADLWTDVLARLHGGLLAQFEGRSRLATWLVLVVRSAAFDHLRRQRGRRRLPPALADAPQLHRTVFREIFIRGRGSEDVGHQLRRQGLLPPDTSVAEVIADLEDRLGDRTLRRIAWDLQADRARAVSGRLLEYLDHAAAEARTAEAELSPERQVLQAEARQTLARIEALMQDLPSDEQRVLDLRFRHGWTARRIAAAMRLQGPREVYTITERALRMLRKMFTVKSLMIFGQIAAAFQVISGA